MMMDEMIENNFYCQPKRIRKQFRDIYMVIWDSLVAQTVKRLPTMWETQVQSLCWEDPLEKGMVTHPVFLGLPSCVERGRKCQLFCAVHPYSPLSRIPCSGDTSTGPPLLAHPSEPRACVFTQLFLPMGGIEEREEEREMTQLPSISENK